MFRKTWLVFSALVVGLMLGLLMCRVPSLRPAYAQEAASTEQSGKILVQGHGRAISSVKPLASEHFDLFTSNTLQVPRHSFKVVPAGKKFILTDVLYNTQASVRQGLTVNIASAYPAIQKHDILFQVKLSPGESDQVHLCSGYVIPAGNALIAFTNAGLGPEQYVSISVTGYFVDE